MIVVSDTSAITALLQVGRLSDEVKAVALRKANEL
jgi:hypothetical protein